MPRKPNDGHDTDAVDTLTDHGVMVEPDVRNSIKKYLKAMGLTSKKRVKVSELRQAIRDAIAETRVPVTVKGTSEDDALARSALTMTSRRGPRMANRSMLIGPNV
jgi:ribosomal protein L30/L7E